MQGKFIVVDGPDGCGKTTLVDKIHDYFACNELHCSVQSEPTKHSDAGRLARDIINGKYPFLKHLAMEELIRVDRIEHSIVMGNSINSGINVVCDRYYFSTMVYQAVEKLGVLRIDTESDPCGGLYEFNDEMWNIARRISEDPILVPDLYIVLNADPLILESRIKSRGEQIVERYETIEKLSTVSALFSLHGYYTPLGLKAPRSVIMVNAGKKQEEVLAEVQPEIDRLFE